VGWAVRSLIVLTLRVVDVRTKDSFARLEAKEIDLLSGGFASVAGADDLPGDYEFLQWRREGLILRRWYAVEDGLWLHADLG
jgi:hypothetical protein